MTFPLKPLKHVATLNDDVLDERTSRNWLVRYAEVSDVAQGAPVRWKEPMKFEEVPSRARRITKHGDILVSTVRTYLRAVTQVIHPPAGAVASTGFAVVRPVSGDSRYLGYALQADGFIDEVVSRSVGVSYPAISSAEIARIQVPSPPCRAQRAIADYLDHETAEIDAFIADLERASNLSRIRFESQLVSLFAAMPNWVPLRRLVALSTGTTPSNVSGDELFAPEGIEWIRPGDIRDEVPTVRGSLKLSKSSANEVTVLKGPAVVVVGIGATVGRVGLVEGSFSTNQQITSLLPDSVDTEYLYFALRSLGEYIRDTAHGNTLPIVNNSQLGSLKIPLAESKMQSEIAGQLNLDMSRTLEVRTEIAQAVNLARERRAALISAAVTGQIDVTERRRHVAEVLEDEVRDRV